MNPEEKRTEAARRIMAALDETGLDPKDAVEVLCQVLLDLPRETD